MIGSVRVAEHRIRRIEFLLGGFEPERFAKSDLLRLKSILISRVGVSRQVQILLALKRLLQFCQDEKNLAVLDPKEVTAPGRPRRAVTFLTVEEIHTFTGSIRLKTYRGRPDKAGIRFKALMEVLLGSAMRISEAVMEPRPD